MSVALGAFNLHDAINTLRQILDDAFWPYLDLQSSGDGVCPDARDGLAGNGLDDCLLLGRPLSGRKSVSVERHPLCRAIHTIEAQN
jgi:hypothetical protein